jgi:hypothetical protein
MTSAPGLPHKSSWRGLHFQRVIKDTPNEVADTRNVGDHARDAPVATNGTNGTKHVSSVIVPAHGIVPRKLGVRVVGADNKALSNTVCAGTPHIAAG